MSFVAFDGAGYQSYVGREHESGALGQLPAGDGLRAGRVNLTMAAAPSADFLLESYDLKAPRVLKKRDGKFWTLYGAYAQQGGYELHPDGQGLAVSDDGLTWRRAQDGPVLSIHDPDCGDWENNRIYMPWLLEYRGRFFDFYNAAHKSHEQTGVAFSTDLIHWIHYPANPIIRNRPGGYDAGFCLRPEGVSRRRPLDDVLFRRWARRGAHHDCVFARPDALDVRSRTALQGRWQSRADWTSGTRTRPRWFTIPGTTRFTCFTAPCPEKKASSPRAAALA